MKTHTPGETKTLSRYVGITLIIEISGIALAYLLNIVLARWLGKVDYGEYSFAYNLFILIALIGNLGLPNAVLKYLPQYKAARDWHLARGFIHLSTLATFTGTMLLGLVVGGFQLGHLPSGASINTVLLALLIAPFYSLRELYMNFIRAIQSIVPALLLTRILFPLLVIGMVFFALQIPNRDAGTTAIGVTFAVTVIILLIQLLLVVRTLPIPLFTSTNHYHTGEWVKTGLYMLLSQSSWLVTRRLMAVILGLMVGVTASGFYMIAERIANLNTIMLTAASLVFAPMISPLYKDGKREELEDLMVVITRWSVVSSLFLSVGLIVFADFLLRLFGTEFLPARQALIIMVLAYVVNAFTGPVGFLLNMTDYAPVLTQISVRTSIMAIVLTPFFIARWGLEGAAIMTGLVLVIQNIWVYWATYRLLHINALPRVFRLR